MGRSLPSNCAGFNGLYESAYQALADEQAKMDAPVPEAIAAAPALLSGAARHVVLTTTAVPDSCILADSNCSLDASDDEDGYATYLRQLANAGAGEPVARPSARSSAASVLESPGGVTQSGRFLHRTRMATASPRATVHPRSKAWLLLLAFNVACGESGGPAPGGVAAGGQAGGGAGGSGGSGVNAGASGAPTAGAAGSATAGSAGVGGTGGAAGSGAGAGAGGSAPLTPALGTPGVWEDVTSSEMDPALFTGSSGFGVGNIVTDPARPTDLYAGGYGSIWKSTDYGLTWSKLDSKPNPPYLALGHVLAVAGTTPATLWMANVAGDQKVFKSTDGGLTFMLTGTIEAPGSNDSLYSIRVDPGDPQHLLSGLHEQDKLLESNDGGATWQFVSGAGWPAGGKSWFPYFVNAGDAATTSKTWFAIAQDGASAIMTRDAGATWTEPQGLAGLQHPHGGSGFFQDAQALFVAGVQGPGDGVYRSTDLGMSWTRVTEGSGGVVWGTPKNVYVMWGWACASCGLNEGGPQYQTAPQPGTTWAMGTVPAELDWGPNSVAVTSDGTHSIVVGSMWATGLWRYVEP